MKNIKKEIYKFDGKKDGKKHPGSAKEASLFDESKHEIYFLVEVDGVEVCHCCFSV